MLVTPGQYHYMVSIEEIIENTEDKTALHKMVLCEKHNNEQMVYYCNNCNVSTCALIITYNFNILFSLFFNRIKNIPV